MESWEECLEGKIQRALNEGRFTDVGDLILEADGDEAQSQLLSKVVSLLTKNDLFEGIREIDTRIPPEKAYRYISSFGAAIQSGREGKIVDLDTKMLDGLSQIVESKRRNLPILQPFAQPILLHSAYLDTGAALKCAETARAKNESAESFKQVSIPEAASWIVIVSANGIYFDRFGERYLESLAKLSSNLHFHLQLSAPTEFSFKNFQSWTTPNQISSSIAVENENPRPVYLISRRFQVASAFIEKVKKPIFVSDLDIELKPSVRDLLSLDPTKYDIALFEFPRRPAMLTSHCSLVFFQPTDVSRFFLKTLAEYLRLQLSREDRLWMLDQIAIFTLSRLAFAQKIPELSLIRWLDLHSLGRGQLDDFQNEQSKDSSEKDELRKKAWPEFRSPQVLDLVERVLARRLETSA